MIRDFVKELAKRGHEITVEEWNNTPLNTYERQYLFEYLPLKTLIAVCNEYTKHTDQTRCPSTYNEVVVSILFPELIARLIDLTGYLPSVRKEGLFGGSDG